MTIIYTAAKPSRVNSCIFSDTEVIVLSFEKVDTTFLKSILKQGNSNAHSKTNKISETQIGADLYNLAPINARDNPAIISKEKIEELLGIVDRAYPLHHEHKKRGGQAEKTKYQGTTEEVKEDGSSNFNFSYVKFRHKKG